MPLYEYECRACHRRTEKIQKFSDPELTVCPHCGGALERTITAPAVQFKGGGWYNDGYSSARKPSGGGDSAPAESKGDAAPAAKSAEGASAPAAAAPSTPAASAAPGTASKS